jgi:hypothetical protein
MKKQLILVPAILLGVVYLIIVLKYSSNVPYYDDYDAVLNFSNEFKQAHSFSEKVSLFISQHNEHRIAVDRFFIIADQFLFGEVNFNHLILVGNIFLMLTYFLIVKLGISIINLDIKAKWILWLPIPFLVLSLQSWENMLWGMASIQNFGVIFFSLLVLFLLFFADLKPMRFCFAILSGALATYSSGNGMFSLIVALFVLILSRKKVIYIAIWAVISAALMYFYFKGYRQQPGHPDPVNTVLHDFDKLLLHFFGLLGGAWAFIGSESGLTFSVCMGVILSLILLFLLYHKIYKQPLLFSILLFLLITCAVTSLTRAGFGPEQGISSRYKIYSLLLFANAYMAMVPVLRQLLKLKIVVMICYLFVAVAFYNYFRMTSQYAIVMKEFHKKLIHGMAALNEGNRYYYLLYPDETRARTILKKSDSLNVFKSKLDYAAIAPKRVCYRPVNETHNIRYDFGVEVHNNNVLVIDNGWAFAENLNSQDCEKFIVLQSDKDDFTFETYIHLRPDVTIAMQAGDLTNSGLSFFMPAKDLPDAVYKLGILIREKGPGPFAKSVSYRTTGIRIYKSADSIRIYSTNESDIVRRPPVLNNKTRIRYYIDRVNINDEIVSVEGWAFFDGISTKDLAKKMTLVSSSNEEVKVQLETMDRPDVSQALNGDYIRSGFKFSIPRDSLHSNKYKLVITLTSNNFYNSLEMMEQLIVAKDSIKN